MREEKPPEADEGGKAPLKLMREERPPEADEEEKAPCYEAITVHGNILKTLT